MLNKVLKSIESYQLAQVKCDICGAYADAKYSTDKPTSLGFAIISGIDPAGFSDHSYEEHACSIECTIKCVKRHCMPHVDFPMIFLSEKEKVK